jgi:hypothetical protein
LRGATYQYTLLVFDPVSREIAGAVPSSEITIPE